jgi:hypothetical protein
MTQLRHLDLTGVDLTDSGIAHIRNLVSLEALTNLQELYLAHLGDDFSEAALIYLSELVPFPVK